MKSKWKAVSKGVALTLCASLLCALAACGGEGGKDPENPGGTPGQAAGGTSDVAGTYSVTFSTQEISGNVRHTGYVSALGGQEKNTLELKADGTYVYTKLLTNNEDILSGQSAVLDSAPSESAPAVPDTPAAPSSNALFSWEPNNEGEDKGTCTLDFFADGTYEFAFPSMGVKENGTWSWDSWSMTIIKPSGTEVTVEMDDDHAFFFDYVADINEMLHQNFIAPSSVWGVALGPSGSYTPIEGGAASDLTVTHYFIGEGVRQTTEGNDYEVNLHVFLLSDGTTYIAEANDNNTAVTLGTWSEDSGAVTVTDGNEDAAVSDDGLMWKGIATTKSEDIPADYADGNWANLISEAQAPAAEGPFALNYVFTGTYTVEGNTVTLPPADGCSWSENWGQLQNYGFTNVSGNEGDKVFPKGPTGESYLPLDHFSGNFLFAFTDAETVTNNFAVKVEVNQADRTFTYIVESAFD